MGILLLCLGAQDRHRWVLLLLVQLEGDYVVCDRLNMVHDEVFISLKSKGVTVGICNQN